MPNADPSHLQIVEWVVGIIILVGGTMLTVMAKMLKDKRNKEQCEEIHKSIDTSLADIKNRLEKGDYKMDGMKETLIEISTTLRERSKDETIRYDRHTEEWKDK